MDTLSFFTIPNCVLLSIVLLLLYILAKKPYDYFKNINIPGPEPWFFFGNMLQLMKKGMAKFDKEMKQKYGKVLGFYICNQPHILISDPEMVKEICIKQFAVFTNRYDMFPPDRVGDKFLSFLTDLHWKFARTVLLPTFSTSHLKQTMGIMNRVAKNLEENFSLFADSDKAVEMKQVFSCYTVDMIASTAFGIEVNSQKNPDHSLIKCFDKFFYVNFYDPITSVQTLFPVIPKILGTFGIKSNFSSSLQSLAKFSKDVIAERRKNKTVRHDFLQLLLDAKLENVDKIDDDMKHELETLTFENMSDWRSKRGLTDEEIVAQVVLFLFAADLTTSTALSFFSYILALSQKYSRRYMMKEEPTVENLNTLTYLDMCMSELLRMYPASLRLQRYAKETVKIKDWIIPKDIPIDISIYSLQHDPEYWPEPHKFIPERFAPEAKDKLNPYTFLPFGIGPRMCIGIKMARLEFKLAIATIIRKYKFVKSPKTEVPLKTSGQIFLYAKNGIWLKAEKR
ncbi:cytochrome P450 3A24 [Octopus sinensis]|uniref:Cytochrome P450 3A24 n=1 Tax=Octopus sinensis TaxID=2607531 RepID=A0A6P7T724_9MOLL|nr:cytochrome P450 3A24 [Octopus sinensis]